MKTNLPSLSLAAAACLVLLCVTPTSGRAGTVAYWRFEEGPADANVSHGGAAAGVFYPGTADSSRNGNDLSVWAEGGAGYAYRTDRPVSVVPQTGAANNFSVQNTGGYPVMFTQTGTAMQTMTPSTFTIEASFKPEATGTWRTLVGRDSIGTYAGDTNLSALYFQITPDDAVAIKFCDVAGDWHEAVSANGIVTGFPSTNAAAGQWYHMAAVSDGSTLSLYLNSGAGYSLVAQTDMTTSGSPDTTLTAGAGDGSDWDPGNWTVGRGLYAGAHTDRAYGFIDEVRINDQALSVDEFLFPGVILTVTNLADGGPGSLRAALAAAANGDTINCAVTGTITLTSGQLDVSNSVIIAGPGAGLLTVSGNYASRVLDVTGTNVIITGLTIANGNTSLNGAGINSHGGSGSILTVSDCVITNNTTTADGGGIYNNADVALTLSNCTVYGNSAGSGGGICSSNAALEIIASTLSANQASFGGGISNDGKGGSAAVTISSSTLSGNHATFGGGVWNDGQLGSATLTISCSTLSSNLSSAGGGICNYGASGSVNLKINASTFSGNSDSSGYGGGIYNNGGGGTGTVEVADTILNAGALGANFYNYQGTITSDGYNLSSDGGGGFLTNATDLINTAPLLGPLQDNGGPTWTHALLAGSPAIDQGKTNGVPGLACSTDQRGQTRPVNVAAIPNASNGDGSDIGAYEFQPRVVAGTNDSGPGSLRDALASALNGEIIDAGGISGTITLTNGELAVPNSVTILGPGPGALTVSGNNASRVLDVTGTNVTISGLTIADGYTTNSSGAGINAGGSPGSVLVIENCLVTNNLTTLDGGGIFNNAGVTLTVSNSTVAGNGASGEGGGIYNSNSTVTVVASTLSGNSAFNSGGAIMNLGASPGATLTIIACTLNNNSASYGAAIYTGSGGSGDAVATIANSTLSDNSGAQDIDNECYWGGTATLRINACTLNRQSGTGIFNDTGTLEIGDTILNIANSASGATIDYRNGTITSDGYNLSSDDGVGFLTNATDLINTDPLLGSLQDNGGPTWTHALLSGSPAIDQGKTNAVPGLACATDQRGLTRPVNVAAFPDASNGDGSDIGAYEAQLRVVTGTTDSGPGSLREALASALNGEIIDAGGISGTITLTNGELAVPNSVTLLGPGPGALTVSGNHASRVFNVTGTSVTISGLTIANGYTSQRGAGINGAGSAGSVLTIDNCIVTNNSTSSDGGGIYNNASVIMTITNCTVSGNHAASWGGGIYNHGESSRTAVMAIAASTISGNSASSGGGIMNFAWSGSATLTVTASTLSSNSASTVGGGIYNNGDYSGSASLRMSACTLAGNSAVGGGGGVCNEGNAGSATLKIGDTILCAGSAGANIYNFYAGAVTTSDGYNLSSDNGAGCLTNATDQINTDPLLGPLQDNGGPTLTHALLPGSPAIDGGKRDAIPALALDLDQRGLARVVDNPYLANAAGGDGTDIGAFEVQGTGGYDTDADGLPDFWELAWFGDLSQSGTDDFDGDGQNNQFECTAGLDPTDPASVFSLRIEEVAGQPNWRRLVFEPSVEGRMYTPEFTTNLAEEAFAPLTGYAGPISDGTSIIITDVNATEDQKLYRIRISLP